MVFGFLKRCLPISTLYPLHWRQKLGISFLRAFRFGLNQRQKYAFSHRALTGDQVRAHCAAKKLPHREVRVPIPSDVTDGAVDGGAVPSPVLHFVTLRTDGEGPTLFYCHGGGYLDPMLGAGHFVMVHRLAAACKARRIVFLEYTLMPYITYPGQLVQVTEAMRVLLHDEGIAPADLIVAGDSAGGHLLVSLFAHFTRPCPGVPVLELPGGSGKQLCAAAVLICPWLTMTGAGAVAKTNSAHDFLSPDRIALFAELFRTNPKHVWAEPVDAPDAKELWDAAFPPRGRSSRSAAPPPPVGRVLVTAGAAEVIVENCQIFATEHLKADTVVLAAGGRDKIKKADMDVLREKPSVFALGPCEVHVQPAIDAALGYKDGSTAVAIEEFLKSL